MARSWRMASLGLLERRGGLAPSVILASGVPAVENGVVMTVDAFAKAMPGLGLYVLHLVILMFSISTMWTQDTVVNIPDTALALMVLPTLVSSLPLSPAVVRATRDYVQRQDAHQLPRQQVRLFVTSHPISE